MTLSHLWIAQIRIKDIIQRLNGQNESMQFTHELSRSVIKSIDVIVYKDFERSYKLQVETFYKINQHASETAHRCQEWHLVKPLDILKQTLTKAISQGATFCIRYIPEKDYSRRLINETMRKMTISILDKK